MANTSTQKQPPASSSLDTLPPITVAAFSTALVMFPVDVVRALRMGNPGSGKSLRTLAQEFVQEHGVKGFFTQGLAPELARASYMRVLKFFLFPVFHEGIWGKSSKEGTPITKGIAGALCVIPEAFTITPLEMAKAGLQLDKENFFENSTSRVFSLVRKHHGIRGLSIGYAGLQFRQSWWTGTYFATLEFFKDHTKRALRPLFSDDESPVLVGSADLIGGFVAGVVGAVPNVPGDLVRTNVQKEALAALVRGESPPTPKIVAIRDHLAMASRIVSEKGVMALWSGFTWKALHLGGSGALMAMFIPVFTRMMTQS